jgi:hypothetical protein
MNDVAFVQCLLKNETILHKRYSQNLPSPIQECGKQQPSRSKKKKKKEGNYKSASSLKIARREQSQWFGKLKMSVFRGFLNFCWPSSQP